MILISNMVECENEMIRNKSNKNMKVNEINTIKAISRTINKNGFPKPLRAKCCECKKMFSIPFVPSQKDWSKKNRLVYWSNNPEDESKVICNDSLRSLYYDKPRYWSTIVDLKKRNILKGYIHHNFI